MSFYVVLEEKGELEGWVFEAVAFMPLPCTLRCPTFSHMAPNLFAVEVEKHLPAFSRGETGKHVTPVETDALHIGFLAISEGPESLSGSPCNFEKWPRMT